MQRESSTVPEAEHLVLNTKSKEHRRVALATLVGTSIEWYDFFIYANAAALVLAPLYFEPFTTSLGDLAGRLLSFATVGVSFLFRPLGAVVAGHLGDRIGRKAMLVATLLLMGAATALIGLVPTYASIGIAAPILLVVLRIIQGFSAGGEWGGAALMAVEHAPARQRGFFGGFPQLGVPIGILGATGVLGAVTTWTTDEQFTSWGWRLPFLVSVVLVVVGLVIRLGVSESPVFRELHESQDQVTMPIVKVLRYCWPAVLVTTVIFAAHSASGYMIAGGYVLSYSVNELGLDQVPILAAVTLAAAVYAVTTIWAAKLSDRIGRARTYKLGFAWLALWAFPMFWMIDTGSPVLIGLALAVLSGGLGLSYGPQPALFAEMFPAAVRYSGIALGNALGAVLGGAFAPMIATWLQATAGTSAAVSTYLAVMAVIGLAVCFTIRDRTGGPLDRTAFDIPGARQLEASGSTAAARSRS